MNTQFKILATALIAASLSFSSAYAASQNLAPNPTKKPVFGFKAASGGKGDIHCSSGSPLSSNVPWTCGTQFAADCKRLGGTLSDKQKWGGKTCFEPS